MNRSEHHYVNKTHLKILRQRVQSQGVKLAQEIGGHKAAIELGILKSTML